MRETQRLERDILQSLGRRRTPVPRNYVREQHRHALVAPERQWAIQQMMREHLPDHERALIGQQSVLDFLRGLGLTRPNGGRITWRMVLRWSRAYGFPVVRGMWRPRHRTPPMSTTYATTAWVLSRFSTDERSLFRVS